MKERWDAIERAFVSHGIPPAKLFQPPATDEQVRQLTAATSLTLPADAESFYRIHNGQQLDVAGILFGIELLSIQRIIENWRNWEAVASDDLNEDLAGSMSSNPPGYIRPLYVNLRWLPLTHDQCGNHIGMDFDPGPKGAQGQVIAFGRDEDQKKLMASSFADFIDMYIEELQSIDWKLDAGTGWQIDDAERGEIHYHDWPRRRTGA